MKDKCSSQLLSKMLAKWMNDSTHVLKIDQDTFEIETIFKDSFAEAVLCFVEKTRKNTFKVTDDGRILFKIDPSASDLDLIDAIQSISLGAGFDFNLKNGVISIEVAREKLVEAIMSLAQLQVNISYLN